MTDLVINEARIAEVVDKTLKSTKEIINSTEILLNKQSDIFERYMHYKKLMGHLEFYNFVSQLMNMFTVAGHRLNHEALQTNCAKEYGWSLIDTEKDSFFIQNDILNEPR